uniref:Sugar phosphate transporter domain-containing protein n=1 Tax=Ananas comosus var. bracteatus TaxID=296719 RepID=A0A6V7QX47_ANACO
MNGDDRESHVTQIADQVPIAHRCCCPLPIAHCPLPKKVSTATASASWTALTSDASLVLPASFPAHEDPPRENPHHLLRPVPSAHLLPRRHSLRFWHPTARVISRPRTHSIFVPGAAGPASAPLPDESNDSSSSGEEDYERNAASEAASTEAEEKGKKEKKRVKLAVVFGLWYAQNVVFNIYNKKPFPRLSRRFVAALLGPALFHTVGHISACVSFSRVAVSFTHVIKASEPVFSVVLSAALLRQFYPLPVWLSVLPIVAGCCIAAATEVSFDAAGLSGALLSNVGFVLRNIYSKQSLREFADVVDGLNLYGCISVVSLLYLVPPPCSSRAPPPGPPASAEPRRRRRRPGPSTPGWRCRGSSTTSTTSRPTGARRHHPAHLLRRQHHEARRRHRRLPSRLQESRQAAQRPRLRRCHLRDLLVLPGHGFQAGENNNKKK